jgi:hypothetical protein
MAEKTRKAVTTTAEVKAAWSDLRTVLNTAGIDVTKFDLVPSFEGGYQIMGEAPEGFPKYFPTKESAKNTFVLWRGVFILATNLIMGSTEETIKAAVELSEPADESAPEVMTPKEIKVANETPVSTRRRRASEKVSAS